MLVYLATCIALYSLFRARQCHFLHLRPNFPVTSVNSSRAWLMESGELISRGMFGAPSLENHNMQVRGPVLGDRFSKAQFQTAAASSFRVLLSLFQGINCVDALLDGIGRGRDGCKLSRSSVNCEGGPSVSAGFQQRRRWPFFLHFGKYWQFLSVPWKMTTVHVDNKPLWVRTDCTLPLT